MTFDERTYKLMQVANNLKDAQRYYNKCTPKEIQDDMVFLIDKWNIKCAENMDLHRKLTECSRETVDRLMSQLKDLDRLYLDSVSERTRLMEENRNLREVMEKN